MKLIMAAFYDYEDDELCMRLPIYLRPQNGMRAFEAKELCGTNGALVLLGINFLPEEGAAILRDHILNLNIVDWMGVERRLVRRGACPYVSNGTEVLLQSFNNLTGIVLDYELVFEIGGKHVHVRAGGRRDLESFDAVCKEIVCSIRLKKDASGG